MKKIFVHLLNLVKSVENRSLIVKNIVFVLFQDYWWALVLGLLGLMGFMSIFVKLCSVHTPSSNPRLKPARALSLKRGVCFRLNLIKDKRIYYLYNFSPMVLDIMAFRFLIHLNLHHP